MKKTLILFVGLACAVNAVTIPEIEIAYERENSMITELIIQMRLNTMEQKKQNKYLTTAVDKQKRNEYLAAELVSKTLLLQKSVYSLADMQSQRMQAGLLKNKQLIANVWTSSFEISQDEIDDVFKNQKGK